MPAALNADEPRILGHETRRSCPRLIIWFTSDPTLRLFIATLIAASGPVAALIPRETTDGVTGLTVGPTDRLTYSDSIAGQRVILSRVVSHVEILIYAMHQVSE